MLISVPIFVAALLGSAAATEQHQSWAPGSQYTWKTGSSSSSTPSSSIPPSSSSKPPYPTGSDHSKPPKPTATETLTTITTVTTCPITVTKTRHSSHYIETTLTTKTLTITSCKEGCHHYPTSYPSKPTIPPGPPGHSNKTHYPHGPTTITTTVPKWIPCSTPVSSNGAHTYYSTWLSYSPYTTTYVSTYTDIPTPPAHQPYPVPPQDNCPPATTVTVTTQAPPNPTPPPKDCKSCYETFTLTLGNGSTTCITITNYPLPTGKPPHDGGKPQPPPESSKPTHKPTGTGSNPKPPSSTEKPTGTGSYSWPKPTGWKAL